MNLTIEQLKEDPALMLDFFEFFLGYTPHSYQKEFLINCLTKTRIAGKWCRQSGKSYTVSAYTVLRAILDKVTIIIVAPTQNQSNELFAKVKTFINENAELASLIRRDTKQEIEFKNGSRIISLPAGTEGRTIRGYTCDILIIEEAGVMDDEIVGTVLIPMLASKKDKGQIIKIGTPLTRNHFYRSCFEDSNYQVVNVVWQDCIKSGQYSQEFIDEQMAELTDIQFKTEYCADFIDAGMMFFTTDLLQQCSATYALMRNL